MPPAARISDMHVCPLVTGIVPHVGGPIAMGMPTVIIGGMPAARVGDMAVCVGPPDAIAKGSTGVFIGGMPAARMGDMTVHGGSIVLGFPTVMIGEVGSGGAGGGGGGGGGGPPAKRAITNADIKGIDDLIAAGKKTEAIDKACEVLTAAGFDLSKMKNGKPTYDPSLKGAYGVTPRQKNPEVSVGDGAFADGPTLLTTIAHENEHATQWADPASATAMGSDARELEAYFVEIDNEDSFGVDKNMKDLNRSMAEKHYKKLSPTKQAEYKKQYESSIGPVPK